jgi:quinoprotein glucose dehydrogenase
MKSNPRVVKLAIVVMAVLALILGVGRYIYSVVGKLGMNSELARNPEVVAYIVKASARADLRAIRRLLRPTNVSNAPAEIQNENFGEMRVSVTREELAMTPEIPEDSTLADHIVTPGMVTTGAEGEQDAEISMDVSRSDWLSPGGGEAVLRHAANTQINAENVTRLRAVHVLDSQKLFGGSWDGNVQAPPLNWSRFVFWISAEQRLIAADVETGRVEWSVKVPGFGYSRRGFLVQESVDQRSATIFIPFGPFIGAFDAATGRLDKRFAKHGVVHMDGWTVVSPLIWNKQLIVSRYEKPAIVSINMETGAVNWTVLIHPNDAKFEGGTAWGGMALDAASSMLYVTVGNPRPALSGITRPGANRNANSLVAISLAARKIAWAFQEVEHDLWDFDLPAAPILTEVTVAGQRYSIVATVTKMGNTLMLNRKSGEPVFDFRRSKAPKSRHIHDQAATYQPDLELPEPLMGISWDSSRVTSISSASRQFVQNQLSDAGTIYGRFRAPELNKDLITFSVHGGAEWHGATVDPTSATLYVPVNVIPWVLRVYLQSPKVPTQAYRKAQQISPTYAEKCASCHLDTRNGQFISVGEAARTFIPSLNGYTLLDENRLHFMLLEFGKRPGHANLKLDQASLDSVWSEFQHLDDALFEGGGVSMVYHWRQLLDQNGLPGSAPPWGKLVAMDLKSGRKVWERPLGEKVVDGSTVETGSPSYGGLVGTAGGLLFVGGTDDRLLRAVNKQGGKTLWTYRLDASASAPPISFVVGGKQYIAVIATGGKFHNFTERGSKLYIFSL